MMAYPSSLRNLMGIAAFIILITQMYAYGWFTTLLTTAANRYY